MYEFIKRLVRAWDPDFTKVTPEAENSGFLDEAEIDWDRLDKIVS